MFLEGHIATMVTCYIKKKKKMSATCLPSMILYGAIIVRLELWVDVPIAVIFPAEDWFWFYLWLGEEVARDFLSQ